MLHVAARISECPNEQQKLHQYEETVGLLGSDRSLCATAEALWDDCADSTAASSFTNCGIARADGRNYGSPVGGCVVSAAALLLFVTASVWVSRSAKR